MKRPQLESSTCSCSLCVCVCIYIYVHASIQSPGASTVQNIAKSFKLAPEGLGFPCTTMLQQLKILPQTSKLVQAYLRGTLPELLKPYLSPHNLEMDLSIPVMDPAQWQLLKMLLHHAALCNADILAKHRNVQFTTLGLQL